jgi:predicted RNase H-like HicB family nuclease/predicted RNA-binding Zn-ribbon protein involved in translation (DUF1610 family)
MNHNLDVVIERDSEGYYVASVPRLPGCHTQARSLDEVSERIREAVKLYPEAEQGGLAMRWYDEESELERYIWGYCRHLMTDLERRADGVALVRAKTRPGREEDVPLLLNMFEVTDGPDVELALSAGWEALRRSIFHRIVTEWGETIINRCPRCRRIVKTPSARQCLWCGHDWHGGAGSSAG